MSNRWESVADLLAAMSDLPEFVGIVNFGVQSVGNMGNSPLHVAAIWGDDEAIRLLVRAGASLGARGEHGYLPLHEAVEQGHFPAVVALVECGAQIDATNDEGKTPRDLSRSAGNVAIERYLTSLGK